MSSEVHYHVAPVHHTDERTLELMRDVHGPESPPMTRTKADILRRDLNGKAAEILFIVFKCYYLPRVCKELHGERQTLK